VRQAHVEAFDQLAVALHHVRLEGAVEQQLGGHAHLQPLAGGAQQPAQHVGAQRQGLRPVGRPRGQHAEALAQQQQRDATALRLAPGDVAQDDLAVQVLVLDQGQAAEFDRGGRGRLRLHRRVLAQPRQDVLQVGQVAGHQVGAALPQLLQLGETLGLFLRAACALGLAEQLPFELVQRQVQRGAQGLCGQRVDRLQDLAHARRERRRGQRQGRALRCGLECRSHPACPP